MKSRPGAIPDDLPPAAQFIVYGQANFGKDGRVWLRFFRLPESDQDYLDVYTGRPRQRLKLEWTVTPGPDDWKTAWLQPKLRRGPMLVVTDSDAFLVLVFPEGLQGRVVSRLFSQASSSLAALEVSLGEPDARGYIQINEAISDRDGTTSHTYGWTGKGWQENK